MQNTLHKGSCTSYLTGKCKCSPTEGELKARITELEYENEVLHDQMESLEDFCRLEIRKLPPEYVKHKQGAV